MKISERQLRRIIRESVQFISHSERAKRQNILDSYDAFIQSSRMRPVSPLAMATFIVDNWRDMKGSPGYLAKIIGEKYGVNQDEINLEVKRLKDKNFAAMRAQRGI